VKKAILLVAAVLLVLATPSFARAQVESTPIPAQQKPDFSSMNFLIGTWTCRTKSSRRPAAYVTTTSYAMDPTGYWIVETSTTAKTAWVPAPLKVMDHITYDTDTKRWVDVLTGDQGAYGLSFSKGWSGNEMTWHDVGFAAGPDIASQTDITNTKVSATKMTSTSAFTEAKTGRKVTVMGACTKS